MLYYSLLIMVLLMVGVFVKKSYKLVNLLTVLSLIFSIALFLNQPEDTVTIFKNSYIIDKFSIYMKILTLLFCSLVLLISKEYIKKNN